MKKRLLGLLMGILLLFAFVGCDQKVPEGEIPEGAFKILTPADGSADVQIYPM